MTDEELAQQAADMVTSWVSVENPMSVEEGWRVAGLQNTGSSQGEMRAFDRVGAWRQQLLQVLAAADDSEQGCTRVARARSEAVSQMREMFLSGIRSTEELNEIWTYPTDPRAELRAFISRGR